MRMRLTTIALARALVAGASALLATGATAVVREQRALAANAATTAESRQAPKFIRPLPESLAAAAVEITDGNLFSPERGAPDAEPEPQPELPPATQPQVPPKPALVLQGIVGGPPWNAVLAGLPGHERPLVVRQGDSVGGIRIRLVKADTVIARGLDTIWTLTLRR